MFSVCLTSAVTSQCYTIASGQSYPNSIYLYICIYFLFPENVTVSVHSCYLRKLKFIVNVENLFSASFECLLQDVWYYCILVNISVSELHFFILTFIVNCQPLILIFKLFNYHIINKAKFSFSFSENSKHNF